MKRILIAISVLLFAAVAVPAAAEQGKKGKRKGHGPEVIQLPAGFQPEGITTGKRGSFFVGSIPTGDIYGGSLRTGQGRIVVDAPDDRSAIGIKIDRRGRIFVAGGNNIGKPKGLWVYDARTGGQVASYPIATAGFINDVVLTRRAAYFTDSLMPVLYKIPIARNGDLGALETIPIDVPYTTGEFNVNGIEAAKGGNTLIVVNSFTGKLFTIDPRTGDSEEIDLGGGNVQRGDGILLKGRTLYVVQNTLDRVTPVKLSRDLEEGEIKESITSTKFNVPTTIARSRGRLYVVNAKFNRPNPDNSYEVVRVPKK
jgi:hypothetical protein